MRDKRVSNKQELLEHIEHDWSALNEFLAELSDSQWSEIKNKDGWTVKDHVAHLTVWENSVIAFLTGIARHEGLGISEELYLSGGIDAMNAAIFKHHRQDTLADVEAQFRKIHKQLLELLGILSDEDLHLSYSHYLPDEDGEGAGPPAINIIYGNTAHHYREHLAWIQEMLESK